MRARDSYDGVRSMAAWLRRILINCYVEQYRHRRRYLRILECRMPDLARAMGGGDPDEIEALAVLASREQSNGERQVAHPRLGSLPRRSDPDGLGDEATAALSRLGRAHRAVVERCMLGSERCVAVARDLGIPLGTLLSRLSRARRALERDLRAYAEAEYGIGHRPTDGRRRVATPES
jgi:RNA polymerase sigma-70 factor (ECF subfamily)